MIVAHGSFFSLPETHIFNYGIGKAGQAIIAPFRRAYLFRTLLEYCNIKRDDLTAYKIFAFFLNKKRYLNEAVGIIDNTASEKGYSGWVEKTPAHLFFISEIEKAAPGAQFIHIVRDGKAASASIVKLWDQATSNWPLWKRLLSLLNDLLCIISVYSKSRDARLSLSLMLRYRRYVRAAAEWNNGLNETLSHKALPGHFICRYEELTTRPESVLRPLCSFLGLEFNPEMLNFQSTAKDLIRPDEPWKSNNIAKLRPPETGNYDALPQELKGMLEELLLNNGDAERLLQ
jgi:hypothetical protein